MLLVLTLMLPSWSSDAISNNVSGPRENSLSGFSSKLTSKDPKSDRHAAGVVGSQTPDRAKAFAAAWTPVCRNYSNCPPSTLDPEVEEPGERGVHQPGLAVNEEQSIVDLMRSVSEELSGLRSALQHLKLDSQAVHRQVKRLQRASCGAARRARRRTKWTAPDKQNQRLPDTGTAVGLHQ